MHFMTKVLKITHKVIEYNRVYINITLLIQPIVYVVPVPVVSVTIRGYPINSNFYSGLQLNLTCAIDISVSVLDNIQQIRVTSQWRRYNTALTQDNRRTITMPQEVGPMLYHTSIIFHSLDKSRDEGDYECVVNVMMERNDKQFTIANHSTTKIHLQSMFNQHLLLSVLC